MSAVIPCARRITVLQHTLQRSKGGQVDLRVMTSRPEGRSKRWVCGCVGMADKCRRLSVVVSAVK